jgi:hypothetical protein
MSEIQFAFATSFAMFAGIIYILSGDHTPLDNTSPVYKSNIIRLSYFLMMGSLIIMMFLEAT